MQRLTDPLGAECPAGGESPVVRIAGRYTVERELARGGMGTVYAVLDESTGRRVALKRLGSARSSGSTRRKGAPRVPEAELLFELEYTMLTRLVHPSLIAVYDYGVDAGVPYYTMELLDGRDLREMAPLPYREACRLVRDVASSLALVHAHRFVHRDVSPRNVRVTHDGRAKLLDFGTLTPFGIPPDIAGTAPSVPPEALNGGALDNRSDLYSLGTVLYWLLTARDAFPARRLDDLPEFLERIPVPPSALVKDIPAALDALVLAMLSRDPLARPASAAEVIERLDAIARLPPEAGREVAQAYFLSAKTVGRTRELASVDATIVRALGAEGVGVLVRGESGFGKTRFAREIAVHAQTRGATVVVVDATLDAAPLATARAIGSRLLQAAPMDALAAATPYAPYLCHVIPELVGRLGEVEPARPPEAPGEWRLRIQAALQEWLLDVAEHRPLLLVVDGVDRADESSASLLASLCRLSRGRRLVVLGTSGTAAFPTDAAYAEELELAPLALRDLTSLVGSLFGETPNTQRLARWLLEVSAGSPRGVMDLLGHLVATKTIRYADGVWMLPEETRVESLPRSVEEALAARLASLGTEALALAESIAVGSPALPISVCIGLAEAQAGSGALALLDELVTAGVLVGSGTRFRFAEESVRVWLVGRMEEARRRKVHLEVGEALLCSRSHSTFDSVIAGHHLLRGGSTERGARLLADAGLRLLAETDDLYAAVPALESALAVHRRSGRPAHELAALVGPLAIAAFFIDRRLATDYGSEALRLLSEATGLSRVPSLAGHAGRRAALGIAVAAAADERASASTDDRTATTRELFELLLRAAMSLSGVACVCLDAGAIRRVLSTLEPLSVLGTHHAATWIRTHCEALEKLCLGDVVGAREGIAAALEAFASGARADAFPERARPLFVGGALYGLSAIDVLRDAPDALEHAYRLESLDLRLYDMVADQVRMLHYAQRGEVELVRYFRDRVEAHAMQRGSAWQVGIWEAPVMLLVQLRDGDVVGLKWSERQLERLAREIPTFEPFAVLARAAHLRFRGRLDEAAALLEGLLGGDPVPFGGRIPATGLLAGVYDALGAHAQAERISGELLESLRPAERQFALLVLPVQIEHARALLGLGDFQGARLELEAALDEHRAGDGPATLGLLHHALACVALRAQDGDRFESHRAAMSSAFAPTKNPSLIALGEGLRHEALRAGVSEIPRSFEGASARRDLG